MKFAIDIQNIEGKMIRWKDYQDGFHGKKKENQVEPKKNKAPRFWGNCFILFFGILVDFDFFFISAFPPLGKCLNVKLIGLALKESELIKCYSYFPKKKANFFPTKTCMYF